MDGPSNYNSGLNSGLQYRSHYSFYDNYTWVEGSVSSGWVRNEKIFNVDFHSFFDDLSADYNGNDFSLTLEFGFGDFWVVGNSSLTGSKSSFGGLNDLNFESYAVATIFGQASISGSGLNTASNIFGGLGVAGASLSLVNGTFRIHNGANGTFSPKYYRSGWKGGSPVRISTFNVAKVGTGISAGANAFTTGIAYYQIANGTQQPITYVDAGVGTLGVMSSIASYYAGIQIPYVGGAVAVYGTARLTWDVFYNLGVNYGPSKWFGNDNSRWFK